MFQCPGSHHGNARKKCAYLGSTPQALNDHMDAVHPVCPHCSATFLGKERFASQKTLKSHIRSQHKHLAPPIRKYTQNAQSTCCQVGCDHKIKFVDDRIRHLEVAHETKVEQQYWFVTNFDDIKEWCQLCSVQRNCQYVSRGGWPEDRKFTLFCACQARARDVEAASKDDKKRNRSQTQYKEKVLGCLSRVYVEPVLASPETEAGWSIRWIKTHTNHKLGHGLRLSSDILTRMMDMLEQGVPPKEVHRRLRGGTYIEKERKM
jgi:hypothetical protein